MPNYGSPGEGPQRETLQRLVKQRAFDGSIRFLGRLDDTEFRQAIQEASLLVQPSEREGQSLIVPEAVAMGTLPLVADGPDTAAADFLRADPELFHALVLSVDASAEAWGKRIAEILDPACHHAAFVC